MKRVMMFATVVLGLVLGGCGYRAAGHATRLPTDVHTIAIPGFLNQSKTYRIEQVLSNAVIREFIARTHYRVVNELSDDADASLRGTVLNTQLSPLTYDSQTGRASSAIITVSLKVSLLDRHGTVLFENPNYLFREQYEISSQITSFFEEESPAIDRLSQDFARTLVSNILEVF